MAFEKIAFVTKLNKGTSRDEWGNFNYWGYKTPDGKIRARMFAPTADGIAQLQVKKFELPAGGWRRKITFDDAIEIGTAYVKVSNADKGFSSDEALKQVNAIIEIHNDYFDRHAGRKIRTMNYDGKDHSIDGHDVTGVSFIITSDDRHTVTLYGKSFVQDAASVIDYTDDFAKSRVINEFDAVQIKIDEAQKFLDLCREKYSKGERLVRNSNNWTEEGLMSYHIANNLERLVNEFRVDN